MADKCEECGEKATISVTIESIASKKIEKMWFCLDCFNELEIDDLAVSIELEKEKTPEEIMKELSDLMEED